MIKLKKLPFLKVRTASVFRGRLCPIRIKKIEKEVKIRDRRLNSIRGASVDISTLENAIARSDIYDNKVITKVGSMDASL